MLVHHLLLLGVTALVAQLTQAQRTACSFSCPDTNVNGQPLLKRVLAIPYDSAYSIFECVYGEINADPKSQSCFYTKADGKRALGYENDGCHAQALSCSDNAEEAHFSSPGHPEVPAWTENGRNLLYLKENHT